MRLRQSALRGKLPSMRTVQKKTAPLYLMYLTYKDDEIYNFDGEKVLGTVGLQEAVYCLASEAEAKESVIAGDDNYWRLWNDVAQNYR